MFVPRMRRIQRRAIRLAAASGLARLRCASLRPSGSLLAVMPPAKGRQAVMIRIGLTACRYRDAMVDALSLDGTTFLVEAGFAKWE